MTTTVEYADDEKCKEFETKLKDEKLMAITHRITLSAVDFVDMSEFNESPIKASEFETKKKEYLQEHSKLLSIELIAQELRAKLSDAGLYVEKISIGAKPYGLENILEGMFAKFKNDMENSLTPPPRTIIAIPKRVSSYNLLACI